jgi:asparagine synthase (glutamine-hydrolysing)
LKNIYEKFSDLLYETLRPLRAPLCLAFSGGVDSSLLATFLKRKCKDTILLSINFLEYGELDYIRKTADIIGLPIIMKNIPMKEFEAGIKHTLETIEYDRVALLENCIGFYFIFKYAKKYGFEKVISGNGVDELFCGYNIFKSQYKNFKIIELIDKLVNIALEDKIQIDKLAKFFNLEYICPFLDEDIIEYCMDIPTSLKINNCTDNIRKHFVRKIAEKEGLPMNIVKRKKKSFQYSSGLHKSIRKIARKKGYSNKKGKRLGYESGAEAYIKILEKKLTSESLE